MSGGGKAGRAGRLALAGAGVLGRTALARLEKVGAPEGKRRAIDRATSEANAEALLAAMGSLRGAMAKLGQLLAQQTHTLPEAWCRRLEELTWRAPPMHGTLARLQLRRQLGADPRKLFAELETVPRAAASLGQVHRALLADGREVAVKVQYPGIERSIESDVASLAAVLKVLRFGGESRREVLASLDEVRLRLLAETDYRREADAMEEMGGSLAGREDVVLPAPIRELSGRRVLTATFLAGEHLDTWLDSEPRVEERLRVGRQLLGLFLEQTLGSGHFHADPHPGNYLILPGGRLGLLDFGSTERLGPETRAGIAELFRADPEDRVGHREIHRRMGLWDPESPRAEERGRALVELQALDLAKYHSEPFLFDDAYLRRLAAAVSRLAGLGGGGGELIFLMRAKLGVYHLCRRLAVPLPCAEIVRPLL